MRPMRTSMQQLAAPALALLVTLAAAPAELAAQGCSGSESIARTTDHAGAALTIRVRNVASDCGAAAVDAAVREATRIDAELRSWTSTVTAAARTTAPAHARVTLSPGLGALFHEIDRWVTATEGAFDPAIGALIDAWDIDGAGRVPTDDALRAARRATGWAYLVFDSQQATCGPSGWWLDTRAFATGAAIRAASLALRSYGVADADIELGGQRFGLGDQVIQVPHPLRADETAARLRIRDAAVATTNGTPVIRSGQQRLSRILDPRTGAPVPAWGSVTVVADDALAADVLATALFVMGPDAALDWARHQQHIAVLVLTQKDGATLTRTNAAMAKLLFPPNQL